MQIQTFLSLFSIHTIMNHNLELQLCSRDSHPFESFRPQDELNEQSKERLHISAQKLILSRKSHSDLFRYQNWP